MSVDEWNVSEDVSDVPLRSLERTVPWRRGASCGDTGSAGARAESAAREPEIECEKRGIVAAVLAAEHYRSAVEIGCGAGELAARLAARCRRYTGMDDDPRALASARLRSREGRFVPLREPFRLPDGEHDLVLVSAGLQRFGAVARRALAKALGAHTSCREIVVVSPPGARSGPADDGGALAGFLGELGRAFEHRELARRRHYRIDALLRREGP